MLVDATNNFNYDGTTEFVCNAVFSSDPKDEIRRVLPLTKNAVGLPRITPAD